MDKLIEREIQKLIERKIGDSLRLEYIIEKLNKGEKLYNSDTKYVVEILEKNSDLDEIEERLLFLKNDSKKIVSKQTSAINDNVHSENKGVKPQLHFQERWCIHCKKAVFPERKFSVGALIILLLIGILPGLLYYALKSKVCPICNNSDWGNP